ncbi:hypothetical protein ACHAXA_008819 [Cyclostephanos tholiformis]|uniref:Cyclin D n=1 Tax=Cyclostephanos tholiformis TaxID=382380 RepID=A0ABD3RS56_9STRA
MVLTKEAYLVDVSDRLKGMRNQEASHYVVPDYLAAEWQHGLREATGAVQLEADGVILTSSSSSAAAAVPSESSYLGSGGDAFQAGAKTANGGQSSASSSSSNSQINELWREKICEWCYQVVDHFDFNREVVSVAMSYLDRYLATRTVNRRIFQLAAMTALYLAIKLYEPGKLRMASLIDLSRGYFMAEHIVTMEDSMLQSLGWHVHPPTPLAFCRDFMRLVSGEIEAAPRHDLSELARFMTELSVCDYWFVTKKPSSIALASLVNAIDLQGPRRVDPRHKVEFLTRVVDLGIDIACDEEILACYERLRQMYDAGGYTPNLEDDPSAGVSDVGREPATRVATVSPTGAADGPDAFMGDDELSEMGCA